MAKVTEVKIGGTVAKTVASASGVAIDVPKDLTPGAYDLLITTPTGSTQFVGAIKVADPVVVAAKAAQAKAAASIAYRAPVDFTVGKTVTAAQAAAAKAFAAQYRNAKTALCLAIPASKSTVAAATAAAAKVCAGFKASIPGIKTSVVVTAPSGDKVNRVSAEIQG
jgi:flavoprotein